MPASGSIALESCRSSASAPVVPEAPGSARKISFFKNQSVGLHLESRYVLREPAQASATRVLEDSVGTPTNKGLRTGRYSAANSRGLIEAWRDHRDMTQRALLFRG